MRGFLILVLVLLFAAAIFTGVIYFSSDSQSSSIHFDKTRLDQVEAKTIDAAKRTVEKVKETTHEVREDLQRDEPAPPPTVVPKVPADDALPR